MHIKIDMSSTDDNKIEYSDNAIANEIEERMLRCSHFMPELYGADLEQTPEDRLDILEVLAYIQDNIKEAHLSKIIKGDVDEEYASIKRCESTITSNNNALFDINHDRNIKINSNNDVYLFNFDINEQEVELCRIIKTPKSKKSSHINEDVVDRWLWILEDNIKMPITSYKCDNENIEFFVDYMQWTHI